MQVTVCVPDPTSATGGPPPELVALQGILEQLNQINGNTDLVESLQAASNSALTNLASYVDGLETMVTSLNSNTDGLAAMMANLGINTDEIEGKLELIKASLGKIELWKNLDLRQGWAVPTGFSTAVPALIQFGFSAVGVPSGLNSGVNTSFARYYNHPVTGNFTVESNVQGFNIDWGLGNVPVPAPINTPGSFGITGIALTSMPVASVKSVTLLVTNNAVEYSTNAGASWVTIAAGTRTWTAQAGASLNVANLRFRGTLATSMYDVIYEV